MFTVGTRIVSSSIHWLILCSIPSSFDHVCSLLWNVIKHLPNFPWRRQASRESGRKLSAQPVVPNLEILCHKVARRIFHSRFAHCSTLYYAKIKYRNQEVNVFSVLLCRQKDEGLGDHERLRYWLINGKHLCSWLLDYNTFKIVHF